MKITKRQLRRIIREESKGSTKKYDDDSALKGDQSKLPDGLQKGIIDKTIEDREEREEEEREEKNESVRITKRQLRRIIREAILSEQVVGYTPPKNSSDDNDGGYETVGSMGVDVSLDGDSTQTQQASSENIESLTTQRQQALDKGDTEDAEQAGTQLSTARKMQG